MEGIELLEEIVRGTGAKLEYTTSIPVLGRCDYQNRIIYISSDEQPRKQILILAHELGHWLTYKEHRKNTGLRRNQREKMAYERGWYLLANTGLAKKYVITREEWHDINFINFTNFDPDCKPAWT